MDEKKNNLEFPVLLFDHECPLCLRFKQSLEKVPGHEAITKISLHEEWIYEELPFLNKEHCEEALHLIVSPEKILIGPEAVEYLIKQFPQVKKFSWLLESAMGQKAVDYFYKMANNYRDSLRKRCHKCRTTKREF